MSIEFREYKDGTTYEGELKDGKRHGFGMMISPNGVKYNGEWYLLFGTFSAISVGCW